MPKRGRDSDGSGSPAAPLSPDAELLKQWVTEFHFTKGDSPIPTWPLVNQNVIYVNEHTEHDSFWSRYYLGVENLSPKTTKLDLEDFFGHNASCFKLQPIVKGRSRRVTSKSAHIKFPSLEDTKAAFSESKGKDLHGKLVRAMRATSNLHSFRVTGFEAPVDRNALEAQLTQVFQQPDRGYIIKKITFPNEQRGLCYLHLWVEKSMEPIMTDEQIAENEEVEFKMGEAELLIRKCDLTFSANHSWLGEDDADRMDIYCKV